MCSMVCTSSFLTDNFFSAGEVGDMHVRPIGHMESVFLSKNGTPRQSGICKTAVGKIAIQRTVFNNPEHSLQGLQAFSHVWYEECLPFCRVKMCYDFCNPLKTNVFCWAFCLYFAGYFFGSTRITTCTPRQKWSHQDWMARQPVCFQQDLRTGPTPLVSLWQNWKVYKVYVPERIPLRCEIDTARWFVCFTKEPSLRNIRTKQFAVSSFLKEIRSQCQELILLTARRF